MLSGGAALGDIIGAKAFAIFVLAVAAVQVGMTAYVQGLVVPYRDAVAYIDSKGAPVAGPASGQTNGTPVEVIPSGADPDEVYLP